MWTFSGAKGQDLGLFGASERLDLSTNGPLGAPRGAPKVLKWVIDAYPVNIGQLDHYVVFGSQSGAVQDFQLAKKCPMGVKLTPLLTTLDPP